MDNGTFKNILRDGPSTILLDAVDAGQDHAAIVPLLAAEIRRSSSRLQRLKQYQNTLASPIYRLHPEILANIFYIYAQANNELFNLRWTRLLFVCRRWHDIAVHILSLWSFIDISAAQGDPYPTNPYDISHNMHEFDSRDLRRIEAQRSRAALSPLTIRMSLYAHLSEAKLAYASMFWNPGSLSSLTVSGEHVYVNKIIRALSSHQHAILETLRLHSYGTVPMLAETQLLLDAALSKHVPKLRYLSITGLLFNWAFVHGLHTLRITYGMDAPASLSLQVLLETLSRSPQLEVLVIRLPWNFHSDVDIVSAAVSLPRLDEIVVQAPVEFCAHLFRICPSLPTSTKVLASTDVSPDNTSYPALTSYLGNHASREGAPIIHSITISNFPADPTEEDMDGDGPPTPRSRLGIVGQTQIKRLRNDTLYRWSYVTEQEESAYIGVEAVTPLFAEAQILENTLQTWPLAQATHLDLRLAGLTQDDFRVLIARVSAATTIVVRPESSTARNLLLILRSYLRDGGQRVFANIIFDAAEVTRHPEHISLNDIPQPASEVRARLTVMHTLLYCKEAAGAGVPLDTIEIANEPRESRHRLFGSAQDVDWSELYEYLHGGFVYEGVLHNEMDQCGDGRERDSLAIVNA